MKEEKPRYYSAGHMRARAADAFAARNTLQHYQPWIGPGGRVIQGTTQGWVN